MVRHVAEQSKRVRKTSKKETVSVQMTKIVIAGLVFAFLAIFFAFLGKNSENEAEELLRNVLIGLSIAEKKHTIINPQVAIGYGSCKDLVFEALDLELFNCSKFSYEIVKETLTSFEELEETFCYYFQHGAASERFTPNMSLFDELVRKVQSLNSSRTSIGGNAALIGKRFALSGFDVLLATSASSEFVKLLPDSVEIAGEVAEKDDIHLIFEYKAGDKCGPFVAPRANRFILHHDVHNPKFTSMDMFERKLKEFHPHLLVISGLQILDNIPMEDHLINEKLTQISQQMKSQPVFTKVHFEMASVSEKTLLVKIIKFILPFSNSLGMNEQELANLYGILKNDQVTKAFNSNPKINTVLDMMRFVFSKLQKSRNAIPKSQLLTRLHMHTLAYQVVMVSQNSDWTDTDAAAARASLIANTYVCDTPQVDLTKSKLEMDSIFTISSKPGSRVFQLDVREPVTCWNETLYHVCISPNIVCTHVKQTAGCGDNVSAAGLTAQV